MYDILILNGKIIDGSGTPYYRADLAIKDGKIVEIGLLQERKAKKIIDARDLVLAPGFIDIHSHSDLTLLINGRAESKIRQGVTTEVIGNCGYSPAPVRGEAYEELKKELKEDYGFEPGWSSFSEFIAELDKAEKSVNVVPLVGHGALRKWVMGYARREANEKEIEEMKNKLKEAMEAGAFGFSTGLIYSPSSFSTTDELVELAKVAASFGGIYTTHMRNEGEDMVAAVREAIKIGERSGIAVQISHHKVTMKNSWGLVKGSLAIMHSARERGIDVSCDLYPYLATNTGLASNLPDWAHEGGLEKMMARLRDERERSKIINYLRENERPRGWENVVISAMNTEGNKKYEGNNMMEISEMMNLSPEEAAVELIYQERGRVDMIRFAMCEKDLKAVLSDELSMVCTDASTKADYGPLAEGKPHPRAFGTFPRVLGKYVRDEGVLSLERAIYKMTGLPAWRLGLQKKGLLKTGMDADITIFNPARIRDRATYSNPFQYPVGIENVIVNGEIVIDEDQHSGKTPGYLLKSKNI